MHYLPGWKAPKMRPEFLTDEYEYITDYLSEWCREMRKRSFNDAFDKYFRLGNNLNQRDVIAVRKTVSGLTKLIYPNGFYDVNFSYIDNETMEEEFVSVPEQGGGKIILRGIGKAAHLYTVGRRRSGMIGAYKIETQVVNGSGKFEKTGLGSDREAKEAIETAFRFFKANSKNISGTINTGTKDYLMHVQDIHGVGLASELTLTAFIALNEKKDM